MFFFLKLFKIVIVIYLFNIYEVYFSKLLLGSKKIETVPDSRAAAARWCGGFQGGKRRGAGRPEPLWRPTCEEQDSEPGPSSEVPERSVSKLLCEGSPAASPRTLKAIQAAMADSSDKEEEDQIGNGGGASPRTLMAIQQALEEEEDRFVQQAVVISDSPAKTQMSIRRPAPGVVLSSSDEEPESDRVKSLPQEHLNLEWNRTNQSLHMKDGLLASSSEDEMDEVVGQRNRDLQLLQPAQKQGMKTNDESNKGQLPEEGKMEKQLEVEEKVTLSGPICAQSQDADAVTVEQRRPTEAPDKTDVNSEASEESDSEGRLISIHIYIKNILEKLIISTKMCVFLLESFIEVSEEEFTQEGVQPKTEEKGAPDDAQEVERRSHDSLEEAPTSLLFKEEEDKNSQTEDEEGTGTEMGASSSPAVNTWEQFDTVSTVGQKQRHKNAGKLSTEP